MEKTGKTIPEFDIDAPFVNFYKSAKEEENDLFLGYVEGFASTTDQDRFDDVISEAALRRSAKQLQYAKTVFLNHRYHENPIGIVVDSRFKTDKTTDTKGIFVKAGISKTAPDVWTLIQEGAYNAFSIGGRMKKTIFDEDREVRVVKDMDLYEVSVVGMPANPKAFFNVAKSYIESEKAKEQPQAVEPAKKLNLHGFIAEVIKMQRGRV